MFYTLWISRCITAARERIPGSIDNYVTGVSECSQQRGNLKDDGYKRRLICGLRKSLPRTKESVMNDESIRF
ncbi:hypothetical protein [Photorhabdus bodei]|uniref:Uncharacterized protein n=1 Tax=Photorhabdus bodei TaxID=2029681 RepID=A0ABX0AS10_9GAMM|nr:hypothetical protein [Photorhabdus bodei]NDL00071.1 hypothetical protein [Photorhabdus bodei]NDL04206.1 hypothetical protein [Photorhabdus bodei]NDL08370.1 hypothetical protein [Photorhabdus bodei]